MGYFAAILTISRWEVKRVLTTTTRSVLPLAIVLIFALSLVSGYAAQSGIHLQDGIYRLGTDDPVLASLFSHDPRFTVFYVDTSSLREQGDAFDVTLTGGNAYAQSNERGAAALKAVSRDYDQYVAQVYSNQEDLFASYPLWIDQHYVQSELTFRATEGGQYLDIQPTQGNPSPSGPVEIIPDPLPTLPLPEPDLRQEIIKGTQNTPFNRYTSILKPESGLGNFQVPSQLTPSLPFDSIISVFVFIFPLYFISQFFMMSIMGERIDRR
ncbi:MAG: PrsW family intramembrane metalloprotease, partial [Methanomicrobiales archaeon]|nr:PrsW family intramembrane metalloprotease [Methanomicrobiales archaeon]